MEMPIEVVVFLVIIITLVVCAIRGVLKWAILTVLLGYVLYTQYTTPETFSVSDSSPIIDDKPKKQSVIYNFYDVMNGRSGIYSDMDIESRMMQTPLEDGVVDDRIPMESKMPKFTQGQIDFSGMEYDRQGKGGGILDNAMMRLNTRLADRTKENIAYNARRADARRFAHLFDEDCEKNEAQNWWEVDQLGN